MGKTGESKTNELREIELLRLDDLQKVAWRFAMAGQLKGIDSVLRIMSHRAKLLGLFPPVVMAKSESRDAEK